MVDISVKDVVKSFDLEKKILDGITFQVDTGERVGLLGKNGAGKTTLFRLLTGELEPDSGQIVIATGRRVGLISQIPVYPAGYTVEDVLDSAFERMQALKAEMDELTDRMAKGESDNAMLRRYDHLTASFEALGGYDTATAKNKVANGLSIGADMRQKLFDQLSGGEKTRVNLACCWTSRQTIWTYRPRNGWRSISANFTARWWSSAMTGTSWTAPCPASSRCWTARQSSTAATIASTP